MGKPLNVADFRHMAMRRLPRFVFDFLEGGCEDEEGLRHNRKVFESIRFLPRRLRNVDRIDLSVALPGGRLSSPLMMAPTGINGILWPSGDLILARAAAREGMPFILSTASSSSIEDVARSTDGDHWFQLYVLHREVAAQFVRRAIAADYSTLVLTVDVPVNGRRERDLRNGFALPLRLTPSVIAGMLLHPSWLAGVLRNGVPRMANFESNDVGSLAMQAALMKRQMDATFDMKDLSWIRDLWPGRLLVKGIICVDDAIECVARGADGIILSNHGGRQLDACVSPMETVASVAAHVACPVFIDSGFRRGADIVKALALGADAALLGRPILYGLAAAGYEGVIEVIRLVKEEVRITLAQLGCASVDEVAANLVHMPGEKSVPCRTDFPLPTDVTHEEAMP